MAEYVAEWTREGNWRPCEQVTRCRECNWLGRETVVPGEYRCERTDRVTCLEDFCSRAVAR